MAKENQYSDEQIRKMLIEYLINKHGDKEAKKIMQNSDYTFTDELIPNNPVIMLRTKDEKFFRSFLINNGKLEEMERVDENSEEGKILYKHR